MKIVRIKPYAIKAIFIQLWEKKKCELPFAQKDFEYWCDNEMPEDTLAFAVVDDDKLPIGGFIAYPLTLPPCLFIQLLITLRPGVRKLFRPTMIKIATALGLNRIGGICPISIATGMERLFPWKEAGKFFMFEV